MCRIFINLTALILSHCIWKQNSDEAEAEETEGKKVVKQDGEETESCEEQIWMCFSEEEKLTGREVGEGRTDSWHMMQASNWRFGEPFPHTCTHD